MSEIDLPDLLTELESRTQLTRRTAVRIVRESERLDDFKHNPQAFIARFADVINRKKMDVLVDGIKYQKIGDRDYYAQELFQTEELTGYLKNMMLNTAKSAYEHVIYDVHNKQRFAQELEQNSTVKVYAKLPGWFRIPTPLGSYNPDWAVVVADENGNDRLYFVVETKGSVAPENLRGNEARKIDCGKAHFEALREAGSTAKYVVASNFDDFTSYW